MVRDCLFFFVILLLPGPLKSQNLLSADGGPDCFLLSGISTNVSILVDPQEDWLVHQVSRLLQHDIQEVTGMKPDLVSEIPKSSKNLIILGTPGHCQAIKELTRSNRIDLHEILGRWEAFRLQTLRNPFKGIENVLLIAGSDKRGAAYGAVTLSEQIGVSPWYWWADVPVKKKKAVYLRENILYTDSPRVKYRGIFINDEAPAFSGWAFEKFGGFNHRMYEKVFELLIRLKANYLWPAMWGHAFNDDDALNPVMADQWGIVMGTSHHEPMLRAQEEWKRYGQGAWDYSKNDSVLKEFWKKGIVNMGHHESIVTIGMRGDGDMPMTQGTAIQLLEKIVSDQREIIRKVTDMPAEKTPQLWALYKEVQDYYDHGMRVPDDITLLFCDDNWGNIRRLPRMNDGPRPGGYGIYYHFDYVGDPRNYKWINTNNIARVWEQMHLAYQHDVKNIWIVNVGDLKPMEFPVSFFLEYAWNPDRWNEDNLTDFYSEWALQQFGPRYAGQIGNLLRKYAVYASRKKPELLNADTYSIRNYGEARKVTDDWQHLLDSAEKLKNELPGEYRDAYFQLVLHPVKAYANLQALYTATALNHFYAESGNLLANSYAEEATGCYAKDSLISLEYNRLRNGKWNHMMDQTHIGYTSWQQPELQSPPALMTVSNIAVSGSGITAEQLKPVFMRTATVAPGSKWPVFYEADGFVSMLAPHYSGKKETRELRWKIIPSIGREGDGICTFPVSSAYTGPVELRPALEYEFYTYDSGFFKLNSFFSPSLNYYHDTGGLQYSVAVDDEEPQVLSINREDHDPKVWSRWVADNVIVKTSKHHIPVAGRHYVKYKMISPSVILQKLVIDFGGLKPSYLGPPETLYKPEIK